MELVIHIVLSRVHSWFCTAVYSDKFHCQHLDFESSMCTYELLIQIVRHTSVADFWILSNEFTEHDISAERLGHRRFREFFGESPFICWIFGIYIFCKSIPSSGMSCHLLWVFFCLKRYLVEHVKSFILGSIRPIKKGYGDLFTRYVKPSFWIRGLLIFLD